MQAGRLLGMLPTWSDIPASLKSAITSPSAAVHLSQILCPQGQDGHCNGRARLLYLLEVRLCMHLHACRRP